MKSLGIFLMIAALSGASVPATAVAAIGPGHVTGVVRNLAPEHAFELNEKMADALPGHVTAV